MYQSLPPKDSMISIKYDMLYDISSVSKTNDENFGDSTQI